MNDFDSFKTTYFEECAELLDGLNARLTDLDEGRSESDTLHAIFRAAHSIKGGGGAFGFDRLVAFAHAFETVLDLARDGRIALRPDVIALWHRSADVLSDMVDAERAGTALASGFEHALIEQLRAVAAVPEAGAPQTPGRQADAVRPAEAGAPARYHIRFAPHLEMFQRANEPQLIVRELKRLGDVTIRADTTRLPDLAAIEPEFAYLCWDIEIATAAPLQAIEEVFEFVADDCELSIAAADVTPPAGGAEGVAVPGTQPDAAAPPALPPGAAHAEAAQAVHSIRVDIEKMDRVVNLVGELVINHAMLLQFGAELPADTAPGLVNGLETLSKHLRELQESVMAMRAQPVRSVFMRMPRLVRELAAQLGKEVHLVITGEETEIDKTVIEQLADPLTHLLRNALDHGIELPERRRSLGKPVRGTIHLGAQHRSGRILIDIADDGGGIDRAAVLAKAESRGLIPPGTTPVEGEIDNLIFLPGLSTAGSVSNISGRGVGMDVVKRNVQALGGRVTVDSHEGVGSRFTLSLPLTLAVLDGMAVAVGRETYIVPLTNVVESLRPQAASIHPIVDTGDVLAIRGAYVPLLYLHRAFGVPDAVDDPVHGIIIIVECDGGRRMGLVVDELLGQRQVVVKSIEDNYDSIEGIGGATILGSGRVALILDISRLYDVAAHAGARCPARSDAAAIHQSARM